MIQIILFGPPGAGKGTQSAFLVEKYNLIHLSTGDIFRFNIKNETELGKLAKTYMDEGKLVPDDVTIRMLEAEVNKHAAAKGFIFDGFPRTASQAEALDAFLRTKNSEISALIALEVPEDELKERLAERAKTSGRADDAKPDVIQNRINVYKNETTPVMDHYKKQDKFIGVSGVGTIPEITERLIQVIDSMQ